MPILSANLSCSNLDFFPPASQDACQSTTRSMYIFRQLGNPETKLVGGFNPSEKYARQNGNLPQIGVKIKNIGNHHLVNLQICHDGILWSRSKVSCIVAPIDEHPKVHLFQRQLGACLKPTRLRSEKTF